MQSEIKPMKEFVVALLDSKLPPNYYYHNHQHTLYVLEKAMEIAAAASCTAYEVHLLSVAALWHDTGYIKTYNGHEEAGCELAGSYLPSYGFSPEETQMVQGMIMATKIPQSPKNKLEEILADADLEYLGTKDAGSKAELLFLELNSITPSLTREEWNRIQISFLQQHSYFTKYCKENKELLKQEYLNTLLHPGPPAEM